MYRAIFASAAVVGAVLIAAPAVADEAPPVKHVRAAPRQAPERAAPAQTQPSWTGSQVGGQGGSSSVAQGFAEPGAYLFPLSCFGFASECTETPFSFNGNKTGATGGGFLGYRIQFGSVVAGVEGDINAKSVSSSYAAYDANGYRAESFNATVKQGADGSIRGRLGYLVTPWTLVYGTGGVAFGSVSGSFSYAAHEIDGCIVCASTVGGGSWSTTRTGATGGGGVETLITQALTLRLEYRYTDLGRFSENVALHTFCAGSCSSPSSNASISLHPTNQAVRVGLGYNF
jgi:outer membrane immunogenic protein